MVLSTFECAGPSSAGRALFLISLPVLFVNRSGGGPFRFLNGIGVLVWLFGFLLQSVGDAELARFAEDPLKRGNILRSGLWQYTRHPNYFGEVAQSWGIWLVALDVPGE